MISGDPPRCPLHVLVQAAAKHFGPGRPSLPGFDLAEDLPAGLVLRHHRNWHQPAGSSAGEKKLLHFVQTLFHVLYLNDLVLIFIFFFLFFQQNS